MLLNKILRYLNGNRSSTRKNKVDYADNNFRKKQEYVPGFPLSKIKQIQMFPDNEKLDREKFFVLNGDASNLRQTANIPDSNGNMITQWTVDGNKIRLTLFNGITLLKKWEENEIISRTPGFEELEKRGSWVDPKSDFLNVIWGMYLQRKEGIKNGFSFFSRSLRHNKYIHDGMGGTAYKGNLDIEGSLSVKKEIWHTGGYQLSLIHI